MKGFLIPKRDHVKTETNEKTDYMNGVNKTN